MQFYLTLLDTYVPDHAERQRAFAAVETIPSIRAKAEFCAKWMDSIRRLDERSGIWCAAFVNAARRSC